MENFWSTYWPVILGVFGGVIAVVPISLLIEKRRKKRKQQNK